MKQDLEPQDLKFIRLESCDAAFRAAIFLLAADPTYQRCSIRISESIFNSIANNQYLMIAQGTQVLGIVLWTEVSQGGRDRLIHDATEPGANDVGVQGVAVFVTAITTSGSGIVSRLWRQFVAQHTDREIIWFRHFLRNNKSDRVGVMRNGKLVRQPSSSAGRVV
jgi:hypothetical protein